MKEGVQMVLTERELKTVEAVFNDCIMLGDKKLNTFVGSITMQEMKELYWKLHYREYCERHNKQLEDFTDEDYIQAYFEEEHISGADCFYEGEWY